MIKGFIIEDLKRVVKDLGFESTDIVLSSSENILFGDYTTNVALQLSKQKSSNQTQSPRDIANKILEVFGHPHYLERIEVAGPGFLNFWVKAETLVKTLPQIIKAGATYGAAKSNQKIQVEFISANPTGPLTLGNGRGGSLGDALAYILSLQGNDVEREYYVNDTGNQVRTLGNSVKAIAGLIETQEIFYKGEYIAELAEKFKDDLHLDAQELGHILADYLLKNDIQEQIKKMGIKFDKFFSERSLYPQKIKYALETMKSKNLTYEKDGAIWFKGSEYGDEQDRVLVTSSEKRGKEEPTYFLADIAYHLDVFERGFDKKINIWGADHHDYGKRFMAAMKALGYENRLQIVFMQFVRLIKDGKEVRMSKRAGVYVTLDELFSLVSPDVARYFFLMVSSNTHIDFNLELAEKKSNENPIFYIQYAHARMSSILEKAKSLSEVKKNDPDLSLLKQEKELELTKVLLEFPEIIKEVSDNFTVHHLATYSYKIADSFHKFYEVCPVISGEKSLTGARLVLVQATKQVLKQSLDLMGISAPDRM